MRCEQEVAGGRDVYVAAAARRRDRARRAEPPALPVRAGEASRPAQAGRLDDSRPDPASRLEKVRLVVPEGQAKEAVVLGHGAEAAPAVVEVLQRIGVA